jgi:aminotransferase
MSLEHLISKRARSINGSGIRRVFDLGAKMKDPVNLSIGQPDFPVPEPIRRSAIEAIEGNRNGYTLTAGVPELRAKLATVLNADLGWDLGRPDSRSGVMVTSGTSGGLLLSCMALLDEGDEFIYPDPWFVLYPHLAQFCHARAVPCDTYPDFRLTAERVERLITPRTKLVLLNSPSNPAGVVSTRQECSDLLDLCRRRNLVLVSDEIYDEFTYSESMTDRSADGNRPRCPTPARLPGAAEHVLVIRGFGKTYGVTGWRLGYAAGPAWLIEQMTKLSQYLYVCAPAPLQWAAMAALDVDMAPYVADYQSRRDHVVGSLSPHTEVPMPGGAFYAFVKVADRLGLNGTEFFERAMTRNVLVVPGVTFSSRDTHFRISYATPMEKLRRGLHELGELLAGR